MGLPVGPPPPLPPRSNTDSSASNAHMQQKCRRYLQDHTTPLACLKREDGTLTTSRFEMEEITERFYSNLYRSTTHVPDPEIPTGEVTPRILPSEVRVAIASMKGGTTPGPDKISTDLLRADIPSTGISKGCPHLFRFGNPITYICGSDHHQAVSKPTDSHRLQWKLAHIIIERIIMLTVEGR
ncbi:hypothetical protein OSTOST_10192 [Ostertagia ostertagi]